MVIRNSKPAVTAHDNRPELIKTTLSALRQDSDMWYRIQVLLYDLSKVARDPQPEKRSSLRLMRSTSANPTFRCQSLLASLEH